MSLSEQSLLQSFSAHSSVDKNRMSPKPQDSNSQKDPAVGEHSFSRAFDRQINTEKNHSASEKPLKHSSNTQEELKYSSDSSEGLGSNLDASDSQPVEELKVGNTFFTEKGNTEIKSAEGIDNWLGFIRASAAGSQGLSVDFSPFQTSAGKGLPLSPLDQAQAIDSPFHDIDSKRLALEAGGIYSGEIVMPSVSTASQDVDSAQTIPLDGLTTTGPMNISVANLQEQGLAEISASPNELGTSPLNIFSSGKDGNKILQNAAASQGVLNWTSAEGEGALESLDSLEWVNPKNLAADLKVGAAPVLNASKNTALVTSQGFNNLSLENGALAFRTMIAASNTLGSEQSALDLAAATAADSEVLNDPSLAKTMLTQFSSGAGGATQPGGGLELINNSRAAVPVNVQFGHERWSTAIAEQTAKLAAQSIQSAEIQMDPPELGPLTVKIHVQNDQATVNFNSSHAVVRDALEQSMARLREMLSEQGMDLVDSGVSDFSQQNQGEAEQQGSSGQGLLDDGDEPLDQNSARTYTLSSGIDYFV